MILRRLLLALTALLVAFGFAGTQLSGASFVSTSSYGASVQAAADWTPPTVSVSSPGSAVSGTTTITATASDARSAVASVTLQYAVADSGSWVTLCTTSTSPYSCAWNTRSGTTADGAYDLRALATDTAGYTATSDLVTTRVVNTAAVVLTDPGDNLRGNVTLRADYLNGVPGGGVLSFQYVASGGSNWATVPGCGPDSLKVTTRSCVWAATATGSYDLRAVATVSGQPTLYDVVAGVTLDNTAPVVSLTVPAAPVSGTAALVATATDADSGVASVRFDYRVVGASTWSTCGTTAVDPWTCALNTAVLPDGSYEFRAVATDAAGNSTTTASQTRVLDNTVSAVSIASPVAGTTVRGMVTVTVDATSTAGVSSVRVEGRPAGGTWATLCTDVTSPYSCPWDTTSVATATADLRAVLTDGTGAATTSAVVTVGVDNSVLRGLDVQVTDVVTSGKPATGDRIALTYSSMVDLTSVKSGWTGASTAVTLTVNDAGVSGAPLAGSDWAAIAGTNLGKLSFTQDYVRSNKTVAFTATMTATAQSVAGKDVTVVTITLGTTSGGGNLRSSSNVGTTRWYPLAAVRSLLGAVCSTTTVVESGVSDKDF